MLVDAFDYDLPSELIAERPAPERDEARLMVLGDKTGALTHTQISALSEWIPEGAVVVVNDTRVRKVRLLGNKVGTGGRIEIFLVERLRSEWDGERDVERWSALGRASKPLREGARVEAGTISMCIAKKGTDDALLEVQLWTRDGSSLDAALEREGHVPLPPYIKRSDEPADEERYQTVFARVPGALAAPTAGLHLSKAGLSRLANRGCEIAYVTLHVGLGTFQTVKVPDLDQHDMHAEHFDVPRATALAIARARDRQVPVVAVGTTVVRTLESAADQENPGLVVPGSGITKLLIQPGYRFRVTDYLLTNFHLPKSTLLALVTAFGGMEMVLDAYRTAVNERYRFFSYGDAMFMKRAVAS